MINKFHGLSPSGGLVSPSGGFASLLFDQVEYFASIKLCQALSRQGAIIKIPVIRCHYLLCLGAQFSKSSLGLPRRHSLSILNPNLPGLFLVEKLLGPKVVPGLFQKENYSKISPILFTTNQTMYWNWNC